MTSGVYIICRPSSLACMETVVEVVLVVMLGCWLVTRGDKLIMRSVGTDVSDLLHASV